MQFVVVQIKWFIDLTASEQRRMTTTFVKIRWKRRINVNFEEEKKGGEANDKKNKLLQWNDNVKCFVRPNLMASVPCVFSLSLYTVVRFVVDLIDFRRVPFLFSCFFEIHFVVLIDSFDFILTQICFHLFFFCSCLCWVCVCWQLWQRNLERLCQRTANARSIAVRFVANLASATMRCATTWNRVT